MKSISQKPIIVIILDDSEPPAILSSRKYYRLKDMSEYDFMMRELKDALNSF